MATDDFMNKIAPSVVEELPNNLLIVNTEGEIVFANHRIESTFGYKPSELRGKKASMLVPDYFTSMNAEKRVEYYKKPTPYTVGNGVPAVGLRKSGEEFPMEIGLSPFQTEQGTFVSVIILDITERHKTEAELVKKNELLGLAEELTQVGHWQWDTVTNEVIWSDNLYTLFHQSREEDLTYATYFSYVYEEDKEYVTEQVERIIRDKKFYDFFHRIKTGQGQIKIIHLVGKVFTNARGEVIEMIGTCQDVTKQKADEKKLAEFNQQLLDKNKELENFAYVAGHDLKEPLRTMSSVCNLLQKKHGGSFNEEGETLIDLMNSSVNRMSKLISDLLDYSQIGIDRTLVTADCQELVEAVTNDLSLAIEEAQAKIIIGKLPVIQCYRTELRLLFQNLISNALKFHKADIPPTIEISAQLVDTFWKFGVKDNGIGIDKESKTNIFKIFHRLHSYDDYQGTGIGLAHCQKIAELHGGTIWVESELEKGSTFFFTIPL
tara:strand:- start:60050 stop:61522 length:1473 start_codon:yes stop_codon:yes gene_type:complete